jgi:ATP-dependent Clp protease ATP-binding subunit ClpB
MMILSKNRSAVLALMTGALAFGTLTSNAFVPTVPPGRGTITKMGSQNVVMKGSVPLGYSSFVSSRKNGRTAGGVTKATGTPRSSSSTVLQMSSDDFNEQKYTEAGWAVVAALTKVADFYQTSTVDSPLMLEIMLNPTKHSAGDSAESARKACEKVLKEAGADVKTLRQELEKYLEGQPKMTGATVQKTMSYSLPKVFDASRAAMSSLGDSFISAEALLLGLVKEDNQFTTNALLKQSVTYTDVLGVVKKAREKNGRIISRSAENNYDALLKYGIDFTEKAEEGKLDPVIGRDDEIRRAIQILSRRTKNNPVLIGDPGVGKTAIAEGIAQRMVAGDVPDSLKGCKLIGLDLAALVAGASMRGEFEERLKSVLEEVTNSDGEIILFIDEMHTVVGAGSAQGSMDASNLLKVRAAPYYGKRNKIIKTFEDGSDSVVTLDSRFIFCGFTSFLSLGND